MVMGAGKSPEELVNESKSTLGSMANETRLDIEPKVFSIFEFSP